MPAESIRTNASAAVSLLHGWLPVSVQVIAVVLLIIAIGRRSRRWYLLRLPVSLAVGIAAAALTYWYLQDQGLAGDPAPPSLWVWITLTGLAAAVLVLGWRGIPWWQRGVSLLAVAASLLCAALALNVWVGYYPTVGSAWDHLTGAPLPGQSQDGDSGGGGGTIVSVTIPGDASGFRHRDELVYLPPAWHASTPPPPLPVVMMIGGEIGNPSDWPRAGDAKSIADRFAADHGGQAPVLVFVDSSGSFANDTECVNGVRGNAADHLTKDVVPYIISKFGVSPNPANWGIVGWSAGGTCALNLTVMHPELFSAFVDIDGQLGPNAGTKAQTIARLFGGDEAAWASFDPQTTIEKHGPYTGISAWFSVSEDIPTVYRNGPVAPGSVGPPDPDMDSEDHGAIANYLCRLASSYGVECAVVAKPGDHTFPSAATAFADALPWLASKIGTPGVPVVRLPGAPGA